MSIPDKLLADSRLWRGDAQSTPRHGLPSGHTALDRALRLGGWPPAGSTELLPETPGIGELSLLLPTLRALSRERRLVWLNPPWVPYAPALAGAGLEPRHCLVLHVSGRRETLWAAEQLLHCGAFAAALTWLDRAAPNDAQLRRLQLAAREGECWHLHFRPPAARQQSSPAPLRIALGSQGDNLRLRILKQPGGHGGQTLELSRADELPWRQPPSAHWPGAGTTGSPPALLPGLRQVPQQGPGPNPREIR